MSFKDKIASVLLLLLVALYIHTLLTAIDIFGLNGLLGVIALTAFSGLVVRWSTTNDR